MQWSNWERMGLRVWMMVGFIALFGVVVTEAGWKGRGVKEVELLVVGATPSGIAAAIAARRGNHAVKSVLVVESHVQVGGLTASGLGKADIVTSAAHGGIWLEFQQRCYMWYVSRYGAGSEAAKLSENGTHVEPSVAQMVFEELLAEAGVEVILNQTLVGVVRDRTSISSVQFTSLQVNALAVIDATYAGDVAAAAGVGYRLGREGRSAFGELNAGEQFRSLDYIFELGSDGAESEAVMAATFRLCLTNNASNRVTITKPNSYSRSLFTPLLSLSNPLSALSISPLPNGKFDVNMNPRPPGFVFLRLGWLAHNWVEASMAERVVLKKTMEDATLGLLYFLQNDEAVPEKTRSEAAQYGLPKDEFERSNNFPPWLYLREGRRIVGEVMVTEKDLMSTADAPLSRAPPFSDAIAAIGFAIDMFPATPRESNVANLPMEGYVDMWQSGRSCGQVPYRSLLPQRPSSPLQGHSTPPLNLLISCAVSASHVAYAAIRLEPTWTAIGEAAGIASQIVLQESASSHTKRKQHFPPSGENGLVDFATVNTAMLQRELLRRGHVLGVVEDMPVPQKNSSVAPTWVAVQRLLSIGAFSDSYSARPEDNISRGLAAKWLFLALQSVAPNSSTIDVGTRWKDFGPTQPYFSEAQTLALLHITTPFPSQTLPFQPTNHLDTSTATNWINSFATVLGTNVTTRTSSRRDIATSNVTRSEFALQVDQVLESAGH